MGDYFVNPYNFISFPKEKAKAYTDSDRHTGFIEYTVTTKTPLFIPNSSSESAFQESKKAADHKSYDFFSYQDLDPTKNYENQYFTPVIPGSEIRGVVRSVYETLTDSCMGILNSEEYAVKRSVARFEPGLLYRKKDKLFLYKARSFRIGEKKKGKIELDQYPNGRVLYYKRTANNPTKPITEYRGQVEKEFTEKGYLIKWGMGVKKARYHLFTSPKEEIRRVELSKETVLERMNSVIESYLSQPSIKEENQKAYEAYKTDFEKFLEGKREEYFPVNYSIVEDGKKLLYLAPAVFTKEVADITIGELAGEFAPCTKNYCPSCDLFGYVGKDNESSRNSKIRFSDLYVTEEKKDKKDYFESKVTLETLGGPKLGNVDFYLEKPKDAKFWTYDYYVTKDGKLRIQRGRLRGRKYYWHHRKVSLPRGVTPTNLNKTIRPLKKGISFKGKLYFEKISEKQLEQLIWILNSGTEGLGLKLGGAKPLGLDSVSLKVEQIEERKIIVENGKLNYKMEERELQKVTYQDAEFSKEAKAEFYKIADLSSVPENMPITYPRMENQKDGLLSEGFRWFVENHSDGGRMPNKRENAIIKYALPGILENNFSLKYLEETKKDRQNSKRNYKYNNHKYSNNGKKFHH